ncbi:MAG: hypothetical protein IKX71_03725 [Bacteroidales bacterium]|nr:hypothetical protein [Bacteroidales bacterium]
MKKRSLIALLSTFVLSAAIIAACKDYPPTPEPGPNPDTEEETVLDTKDFMIVPWEGGIQTAAIDYNTDFEVVIDAETQPWVEFIRTKATSHGNLEFKFAANDCYSSRIGKATVKDKKGKADPIEITFIQEEKKIAEEEADIYSLGVTPGVLKFNQEPFVWKVTPRYDYSKLYMSKLFLCLADYDGEYLGWCKMRDNGKQEINMTFEQALEVIKGIDAITPGLQKIIYLVGWQYLGHDSKYPAFFEGNEALKRPGDKDALESLRWLMSEARNYNTIVSLHINMFDCYVDSPIYQKYLDADVLCKDVKGNLIHGDWGYKVCYPAEWDKGLAQWRLDTLCQLLPLERQGTLHIDAFHNKIPIPGPDGNIVGRGSPISPYHGYSAQDDIDAKKKIVAYMDSKGIDITCEGTVNDIGTGVNPREGWFPAYWGYSDLLTHILALNAQQATGPNCSLEIIGTNTNAESIFYNGLPREQQFEWFKKDFCKKSVIYLYLNNFGRKEMLYDPGDSNGRNIGVFEKGVRTFYDSGNMHLAKDGIELAEGGNIFVPAVWLGDQSIVAYSETGYSQRTWTIPAGCAIPDDASAYTIDYTGRTAFTGFKIDGRQITISLNPGQMVLITADM